MRAAYCVVVVVAAAPPAAEAFSCVSQLCQNWGQVWPLVWLLALSVFH
jgi:hypothetical protein